MGYKISVVVPAYNSESTLPETLDCLLGQSLLREVQIVAVNDGSTDSTPEIIGKYASEHDNILFVSKENGGVSSARNAGIEAAEGKYCIFLDADDLIDPQTCEEFYNSMENTGASLGIGRLAKFGFGGSEYNPVSEELAKDTNIDFLDVRLLRNFLLLNKCFRTDVLKESGVRFPDTKYSEDGAFIMSFVFAARPSITGVYGAVSRYRRTNPAEFCSATRTVNPVNVTDYFRSMEIVTGAAEKYFDNTDSSEGRKEYLNEIKQKICNTVINEFYRQLWHMDDGTLALLGEKYSEVRAGMDSFTPDSVNRDIGEPVFSKKEVSEHPAISVICAKPSREFLDSLYYQTMPLFELVTDNPGSYSDFENISGKNPKSAVKVKFSGKKAIDPRLLRVILLMNSPDSVLKKLPGSVIKSGACAALKLKDMKTR